MWIIYIFGLNSAKSCWFVYSSALLSWRQYPLYPLSLDHFLSWHKPRLQATSWQAAVVRVRPEEQVYRRVSPATFRHLAFAQRKRVRDQQGTLYLKKISTLPWLSHQLWNMHVFLSLPCDDGFRLSHPYLSLMVCAQKRAEQGEKHIWFKLK